VLADPGFDHGSAKWEFRAGASAANDDASACSPSPGSVKVSVTTDFDFGTITQCVSVAVGSTYYFGYHYKQAANTSLACMVEQFATPDCSGSLVFFSTVSGATIPTALSWTASQPESIMPEAGVRSVRINCQISSGGPGYFDEMYLNTATASF
jgi:hypothetical protein